MDPSARDWLAISAVRDAFSVSRRTPATYKEAIGYAMQIVPDWIGPESLMSQGIASTLADYYRAKAATLSQGASPVPPVQLAQADLAELDSLIQAASEEAARPLIQRSREVRRALSDLDESNWTENQALVFDYGLPPHNQFGPLPVSDRGQGYLEYRAAPGRVLRVRMLHPDPAEWKLGLDLMYETYRFDPYSDDTSVRIAALQYKNWNGRALYISDGRTERQMSRAHDAFCSAGLCDCADRTMSGRFRFPHCCVFLRPTDRVQKRRGWQATKGWHIPMCEARDAVELTDAGGKVLRAEAVRQSALNQLQFAQLFGQAMIGSDWMSATRLERVYAETGAMSVDRPVLHVQEYPSDEPALEDDW